MPAAWLNGNKIWLWNINSRKLSFNRVCQVCGPTILWRFCVFFVLHNFTRRCGLKVTNLSNIFRFQWKLYLFFILIYWSRFDDILDQEIKIKHEISHNNNRIFFMILYHYRITELCSTRRLGLIKINCLLDAWFNQRESCTTTLQDAMV